MKKLYGITVAMVTPMDEKGQVDLVGVAKLTEMLIAKGVHCLYPCGTTGEMLKLTTQERKQIAETVVKTAAGRVTVFIHTGAESPEKTLELSLHAQQIGADGVGIADVHIDGGGDLIIETTDGHMENVGHVVGADGQDYVLTAQDKSDIADIVLSELPTTQGVLYGNTSN